jgi:hypothetical protein
LAKSAPATSLARTSFASASAAASSRLLVSSKICEALTCSGVLYFPSAATQAAKTKAQADEIAQQQRLLVCQVDPANCKP